MAAKLYGLTGGVQVQMLRSGVALASSPPLCGGSPDQLLVRDQVTTGGNLIGDQVSLGVFRPTTFLDALYSYFYYDAFGAGCTLAIGDVTFPTVLRQTPSIAAAGALQVFGAAPTPANLFSPLWKVLGYASNPGVPLELLATFGGANPANAKLGWQLFGRNL